MGKAQTEAITLVLISGIVISLVGFAYAWGKPMIEKRSTLTQFTSAIRFMEELDNSIVGMAGTCSSAGSCEETLTLPVQGMITINETKNTISYTFFVNQPLLTRGEIFFNTADNGTVARYGETPGVISMIGSRYPSGVYELTFMSRYRELDSEEPWRGYLIKLVKSGKESGTTKILISYDGTETQANAAYNHGDLVLSKIKVQPV
jgi:hypothetical protein